MALSNTTEYRIWESMKQRCNNPNHKHYMYYGGRGITFCDSWSTFSSFFNDMGPRPPGQFLDREDSNLPYSKDNCRWATWRVQSLNKRKQLRNKTGVIGVDRVPSGRYCASIRHKQKKVCLGTFDTIEEAKEVRMLAELKYYGFYVNE